MPAKRELSSSQLIELYQGRKLPIRTIAGILGCGASTVESHLRALSVTLRSKSEALTGKRYVDLPEGELSDLYLNKRLSSRALAERYSVSRETVTQRLRALGISRKSKWADLPGEEVISLYVERGWTVDEVAEYYGCRSQTIKRMLCVNGVDTRSGAESRVKKLERQRKDFAGDLCEKAYLLGFRSGDLGVRKNGFLSSLVSIHCSSTQTDQIDLIRQLFGRYAPVRIYDSNIRPGERQVLCTLNKSFQFLLDKPNGIPEWINKRRELFAAFFAGYCDAEGCFFVRNKENTIEQGGFSIGSSDKTILEQCRARLIQMGIACTKLSETAPLGRPNRFGITTRKKTFRFQVTAKESLIALIEILDPYIHHRGRRADMERVKENVLRRRRLS